MVIRQRHDTQRAKQKLNLALEQDPKLPEAWYSMGFYLEAVGDIAAARKYYQKSVDLKTRRQHSLQSSRFAMWDWLQLFPSGTPTR